jgi:hypothetical protein
MKAGVELFLDISCAASQENRSSKLMEASMGELTNWLTVFGGMSGAALAALIVLGAFGLAAFAIPRGVVRCEGAP